MPEKEKKILHTILLEWDQISTRVEMRFNNESLFHVSYRLFQHVAAMCFAEARPENVAFEVTLEDLDKYSGK